VNRGDNCVKMQSLLGSTLYCLLGELDTER